MTTAIILHGSGGTAHSFWIPWLANQLTARGYHCATPTLPHNDLLPDLDAWLSDLMKQSLPATSDLLIGHSAGSPLAMRFLQAGHKTRHLINVAGYMTETGHPQKGLKINAQNVIDNSQKRHFINSVDDPWGCDATIGKQMAKTLKGTLIAYQDQGHFGSDTYNQPYTRFPDLLSLCLS